MCPSMIQWAGWAIFKKTMQDDGDAIVPVNWCGASGRKPPMVPGKV